VYEEVCDRLTDHGGIDASSIEVRCEHGEITLEGLVPDRETKRLAESIAESARGVRDVHNRLRVG
jgi:osmotically-inducible protein OsmY